MKQPFICLIYVLSAFATLLSGNTLAADYDHSLTIRKMMAEWTVAGENLNIRLSGKTKGWLAIGFNPTDGMKGGNFILGYVKKGKVVVTDEYGVKKNEHRTDTKIGGAFDITNISGSEKSGKTTISFTIPLDSGDPKDTVIQTDRFITMAFAHSARRDSFKTKHLNRTKMLVHLGTGESKKIKK